MNVSGSLLISVSRSAVSEIYGVTSRNTAVSFPASGFYSAVLNATGSSLYSIQLLSLPASNQGTVYVGSGTSIRANTTQYTYASGSNFYQPAALCARFHLYRLCGDSVCGF